MLAQLEIDPLSPPAPRDPYYDPSLQAWVLSRHADVLAAFRTRELSPAGPRSKKRPEMPDAEKHARTRAQTFAMLSPEQLERWRCEALVQAQTLIAGFPPTRAVDIVQDVAEPWSLWLAILITRADPRRAGRLSFLAERVSALAADPLNSALESHAKRASAELERSLEHSPVPMSGPAFVALSQTLPRFLANAWLALSRFPEEFARLRAGTERIQRAVEELLRFAGIARMLFRQALTPVELCGIRVAQGERIGLMLASVNRDPARFPEPNRLDLTRCENAHVALGAGEHSCAGGVLIRMASAVAIETLAEHFVPAHGDIPIQWRGGSGFRSPKSLYALRRPGRGRGAF